jgi:excisionase family DNA binding protein
MTALRRMPDWPGWMKKETIAAYCDIQPGYVDQLVKRGELPPPRKCGEAMLWSRAAVDAWLAGEVASDASSIPDPYMQGISNGAAGADRTS